ncbi:MAG: zinc ribbon domain-containing protein [Clostridia bacterium]|nr:zinc ribbon domain-containing protein [Clostridia bacterium]
MALIHCPECGREISDKATICPHCGNPMSSNMAFPKAEEKAAVEVNNAIPQLYGEEYIQEQYVTKTKNTALKVLGWIFAGMGLLEFMVPSGAGMAIFTVLFGLGLVGLAYIRPDQNKLVYASGRMSDGSICCPRCGSTNIESASDVSGQGVDGCAVMMCGPCGLNGAGSTTTKNYWMCKKCGTKFER